MNASELEPIEQFLQRHAPFALLTANLIERCARGISIGYYAKASAFVEFDAVNPKLYLVRSGAFEVRDPQGLLVDRVAEGECFGFSTLLSGEKVVNRVAILEDGLVYQISLPLFNELRNGSREFDTFFTRAFAKRLGKQQKGSGKAFATTGRITHIMSKSPVCIEATAKVQAAASLMRDHRVSSVLVVESQGLVGILTDRDLRNRVLAQGLDGQTCVAKVMTIEPQSIGPNGLIFEAMLLMSEHNIHHLPVLDNGQIKGVLTSTDMLRAQGSQPLLLIGEIDRQDTIDTLVHVSKQIPMLLQNLIGADARAEEIGRVLTSVTDALTRRLIVLNQRILGDAPMAFCWLAFGSQGRQDQAACSDQDNGLLLVHEPDASAEVYFDKLTHGVCQGLDLCGYIYCPGDIMAQNPKWRLSLASWQKKFSQWVASPDPKALMHASIFFDMRAVYGPQTLFDELQDEVLGGTKNNDIFLAAMAGNAIQASPPLGFFRQFVLERDGSEVKGMDLKHKGSVLVNDIARVYSLSAGIKEVNTAKRIQALMQKNIINREDGLNLADAHEFIAHMRLANQGYQASHNVPMSNYLKPQHLSALLRHQLRDAFNVVHDAQSGLKLTFLRRF